MKKFFILFALVMISTVAVSQQMYDIVLSGQAVNGNNVFLVWRNTDTTDAEQPPFTYVIKHVGCTVDENKCVLGVTSFVSATVKTSKQYDCIEVVLGSLRSNPVCP